MSIVSSQRTVIAETAWMTLLGRKFLSLLANKKSQFMYNMAAKVHAMGGLDPLHSGRFILSFPYDSPV